MSELDEDYENTRYIPRGGEYPALWSQAAKAFRLKHPPLDVDGSDVFLPPAPAKGLMVFIHGGYWMETGRADWSHLAHGAIAQGWAVAVPSYRLAPAVRISDITAEVGRAISRVAAQVAGPIALSGHSAGGHLAVRMICQDSPLPAQVHERITACVPISGIFDLRPLLRTSMREVLRLDEAEARAESPILSRPRPDVATTVWVGTEERPEFIRQSRAFVAAWQETGARITLEQEDARHHFDVIEALTDPHHPIWHHLIGA